jgi:tetratricopeptide (TPR) repeat protein
MSDSYTELIQTTLEHYRQGCAKPIQIVPKSSGEYFEYLLGHKLQTLIKSRLSLTDQLLIDWSTNVRSQGLVAARCGQFATAEQLFAKARTPLESSKLSPEGSLLYKSSQEPAEAYLDYRRGDFDRARTRISEALAIDAVLEEKYGYKTLFIHRLHLVHNLVRTEARCMCFDRAIELACQLLSYLEGASEVLPLPVPWGSERVAHLSPELVAVMFAQVTDEVALILAGKNRQLARDLFAVVVRYMKLQADGNCHPYPRTHAWFLVKQAFVSNDVATFLERASHFLAEGRTDIPLLWYATVIDLVTLCDELDFPDSNLVKQEVAKEAVTWEDLPQKLFPLLGVHPITAIAT